MARKTIIDISKNTDDNFNNILEIVTKVLNSAMAPFIEYLTFDTADQFLEFMQYDYNSLYTATVYGLLTMLANTYSEGLPISEILKIMPNAGFDDQTNRKRLERIHKKLLKRNSAHARYLSAPEYTPRLLAFDALWYDFLCEYPMINRFLHEYQRNFLMS